MKRTGLLLAILWIVNTGWSQALKLESGAEFGGGICWLSGTAPYGNAFSPIIGISVLYKFTDNLGLRTGMDYQRKGNKIENSNYFTKLDYISIPLCVTVMTGRKTKIYLHSGIYLAYLLQGRQTIIKYEITRYYNRFDIGYCFEPGIVYPLKNDYRISAGLRFSEGVINISNRPFQYVVTNALIMVIGFSICP